MKINPEFEKAKGRFLFDDPNAYKEINVGPPPKLMKDQIEKKILEFPIAGLNHHASVYEDNVLYLGRGATLRIEAEPDNKYDKHAHKILTKDKQHLGYVPKEKAKQLHFSSMVAAKGGKNFVIEAHVSEHNEHHPMYNRLRVKLTYWIED